MQNQSKIIPEIDERPKGREGIAEMIERMFETDENGDPEKTSAPQKATA